MRYSSLKVYFIHSHAESHKKSMAQLLRHWTLAVISEGIEYSSVLEESVKHGVAQAGSAVTKVRIRK